MKPKRITAFLLAMVMMISLLPRFTLTASAAGLTTITKDDGKTYYRIYTADDLYAFAEMVNGGTGKNNVHACLENDITVNSNVLKSDGSLNSGSFKAWTPIGTESDNNEASAYGGTFDGQNHTISGLYFNDNTAENVGFFGILNQWAHIKNVGITASYFSGKENVGGLVGYARNNPIIDNSYSTATVNGTNVVGVLVGRATGDAKIRYCFAAGKYSAKTNGGPFVGLLGNMTACYAISDSASERSGLTYCTEAEFASGMVAYKLDRKKGVLGQKIGTDKVPCFGGAQVYYASGTYHNHLDSNMLYCEYCDAITPSNGIYNITTAKDLYWFAGLVKTNPSVKGVLKADIVVSSNWEGIPEFKGSFSGEKHIISGSSGALFKKISADAQVQQVGWQGKTFAQENSGTISDCYVYSTSAATICQTNSGTLSNCYAAGGNGTKMCTTNSGTRSNCYALSRNIAMKSDGTSFVTSSPFASGEVAHLLQNGRSTQIWGQSLGTDNNPILTSDSDKKVHKVTFRTITNSEYAVKYVNNDKTLGDNFTADPDDKYEYWWSEAEDVNGEKFTKDTTITKDMTVYGVKREITVESDENDTITLNKNTETTIDLNDYVQNKSGDAKNFTFALAKGQNLPDGLEFEKDENHIGKITGTPIKVGTYTVKFNVANNGGISLMSLETVNDVDVLTLTFDVGFEYDNGKENNPYQIWDLSDLEYFRDKVNGGTTYEGKYVKLMADIDMSTNYGEGKQSWTPIGDQPFGDKDNKFKGNFDGGGFEIKNLYINNQNNQGEYNSYQALFGCISGAAVKNLTVGGTVNGKSYSAGIVGCAFSENIIENCINNANVTGVGNDCGGVVGKVFESTIKNCCNTGNISGVSAVGGVVGEVFTNPGSNNPESNQKVSIVENCYNTGSVSSKGSKYVGGIVGDVYLSTLKNSYNTGTVTSSGATDVGGAVGVCSSDKVESVYYLDTCAGTDTTFDKSTVGEAKTADEFASGEVAWLLQNGQTDKTVQVWGQKLNETDSTKNDEYPVFTNEADKKVYKVAKMANTLTGGDYTENSAVYGNDTQTVTLNGYKGTYANKLYGWTAEKNSRTLITECTINKADTEVYSVWNELTFEISDEKQKYKKGTARTITLTPKINGTENDNVKASAFDVKYYEADKNTGKLMSTEAVNAISKGKYLYVISFAESDAGTTAQEYCNFKNAYTVTDTTLPTDEQLKEFDNVGFMYITSSGGGSAAPAAYTVIFETNGGSKVESVKVDQNSSVTEPTKPTKSGYTFAGWYSDKALTNAYDFSTKVTKNITLYAKWTEASEEWENPFTDVKENDWFYENVNYAVENGLFNGKTDTTFAPNDAITRAMFVTVLYRAEAEPSVDADTLFADVNASQYYANAVIWAQQNGIVNGVTETQFAPDKEITREQIAAIMLRYAKYKGTAPKGNWAIKLDYADTAEISDYAVEGVMYCRLENIMQGKSGNKFAPKDSATRAEIAAILQRFVEGNK